MSKTDQKSAKKSKLVKFFNRQWQNRPKICRGPFKSTAQEGSRTPRPPCFSMYEQNRLGIAIAQILLNKFLFHFFFHFQARERSNNRAGFIDENFDFCVGFWQLFCCPNQKMQTILLKPNLIYE